MTAAEWTSCESAPLSVLRVFQRVFARVHRQECKVHLDYLKLEETYISFSAHEYRFLQRGEQEAARFPPRALVCCFVCVYLCAGVFVSHRVNMPV